MALVCMAGFFTLCILASPSVLATASSYSKTGKVGFQMGLGRQFSFNHCPRGELKASSHLSSNRKPHGRYSCSTLHSSGELFIPSHGKRRAFRSFKPKATISLDHTYIPFGEGSNKIPDFVLNSGNPTKQSGITAHRYTSQDWLSILKEMPNSVTLRRIRGIITAHILWTSLLTFVNKCVSPIPQLGSSSLVTPALGLLLVFRTNAAYNRFWEGRQIWEKLLDKSRCLVRYACLHEEVAGREKIQRIANLTIALALTLKQHLTSYRKPELDYVEQFLLARDKNTHGELPSERKLFQGVSNRPLFIANKLGEAVFSIPEAPSFSSRERLQMLKLVDEMTSTIGACERIVQTPVPLNYARHTSRFLTFWCLTLPFTLIPELGVVTVPIMAMIVWGLFGIQEIGLMIEEPFRSCLPLHAFVDNIYHDVDEAMLTTRSVRARAKDVSAGSSDIIKQLAQSRNNAVSKYSLPKDENPPIEAEKWAEIINAQERVIAKKKALNPSEEAPQSSQLSSSSERGDKFPNGH